MTFQCCQTTPDPAPWTAGKDDSADPDMVRRMHGIRDRLSYNMPLHNFIACLKDAVHVDGRTRPGYHLQACLMWNAVHRLEILGEGIDPDAVWRRRGWPRLRDAWAVFQGRAVVVYVKGNDNANAG